jgi:LmbE family N-acetylglucosaminyl deacetylase
MTTIFLIIIILISSLISAYFFILHKYHEFNLPKLNLEKYKKVLVIYPHPDDETMVSGSFIQKLVKNEVDVEVISLTKGEKGDEVLKLEPRELAKVRSNEFESIMKTLGVRKYLLQDFGDGMLKIRFNEMKDYLKTLIQRNKYDLIVTYEKGGMYGHSDHVALSKAIHEIHQELNSFQVLYSTLPRKIEEKFSPKKHMRNDIQLEQFDWNQSPEFRLSNWKGLFQKYRALRKYKSQKFDQQVPLWAQVLFMPFEYYTTRYERGGLRSENSN